MSSMASAAARRCSEIICTEKLGRTASGARLCGDGVARKPRPVCCSNPGIFGEFDWSSANRLANRRMTALCHFRWLKAAPWKSWIRRVRTSVRRSHRRTAATANRRLREMPSAQSGNHQASTNSSSSEWRNEPERWRRPIRIAQGDRPARARWRRTCGGRRRFSNHLRSHPRHDQFRRPEWPDPAGESGMGTDARAGRSKKYEAKTSTSSRRTTRTPSIAKRSAISSPIRTRNGRISRPPCGMAG